MLVYKYLDVDGAKRNAKNKSVVLKCPIEYNDLLDSVFYTNEEEKEKAFDLFTNYYLFQAICSGIDSGNIWLNNIKGLKEKIEPIRSSIRQKAVYKIQKDIGCYQHLLFKVFKVDKKTLRKKFDKIVDDSLDKIRNRIVVSCFGSTYSSFLMWSHYAEKHKGICIEYEINDTIEYKNVDYVEKLPIFRLTDFLEIIFGHQLINKQIDVNNQSFWFALEPIFIKLNIWEYEGEVRCIYSKRKRREDIWKEGKTKLLRMSQPKRIFLGCKTSKSLERTIRSHYANIKIEKMKLVDTQQGILDIE